MKALIALLALLAPTGALAAAIEGQTVRQPTNWTAIVMFAGFVALTLAITRWAATRTRTAADFYTAGGHVTGFQNGLAIAGDFMSAASFLGISAQIFTDGYDGLIYSIGFLVGWPILMFLMAEKLRNLGRFTFADVASFRFAQPPVRSFSAFSTLAVVAFYLIAQMVGAGQLIKLLFGLPYGYAVAIVGVLMILYVLFAACAPPPGCRSPRRCCCWAGRASCRSWCWPRWASRPRPCSPALSRSRPTWRPPRACRRPRPPRRAARSWARATSSRTRSRRSPSAWP